MIKNLVSFGCSWTYGDELVDPNLENVKHCMDPTNSQYRDDHSYPGLIANHFGLNYINLSYPGASLQSLIWNLNWWIDNASEEEMNESFVLVGLTDESRNSWYNPYYQMRDSDWGIHRYMHSIWLSSTNEDIKDEPYMEEWRQLHKLYYMLSDCEKDREMRYTETIRFYDGISARYNIPMLQVKALTQMQKPIVPTLDNSKVSLMEMLAIRDRPRKDPLFKPGLHPNEKGHKIISEYLIPKVESVIINR